MPTFTKKHNIIIAVILLVSLIGMLTANAAFNIMPQAQVLIVFANYATALLGAFIGIYASIKIGIHNFVGKGLLFLGLGSFFSFIGYLLWDYTESILLIELPYPSIADVSWSLSMPLGIIGVYYLVKIYQPRMRPRFILETAFIFLLASAITIYLIGWPDFSESTFTTGFFDVYYTITDIAWLALTFITLRIAGGRIFAGLLLYAIATFLMAVGDILFAIRMNNGTFFYGDIADLTLLFGWICATAGIYLTAQTFSNTQAHA